MTHKQKARLSTERAVSQHKIKASLRTATIIEKMSYFDSPACKIVFNPGLPYDEGTKGLPHKEAWCIEVKIQGTDEEGNVASKYLILCGGKLNPDFSYIYHIGQPDCGMDRLDKVMMCLDYFLVDEVEKSLEELRQSGKAKLTENEREALGIK